MENRILQGLVEAVAGVLTAAFDCPVYQDDIPQGFKQRSILLKMLEPARRQQVGRRYLQQVPFDLVCFPEKDGDNRELTLWADRLFDLLEFIPLAQGQPWNGGLLRGNGMRYQVEDGVLHFFVTYRFYLLRDVEETYMEEMKINTVMGL